MVDQDLLGASFWGWAGIATAKGMNYVSNTLIPDSNPLFEFEGKRVDLSRMCKHSWGQAVICTKMGKLKAGCETKNEFAVVVCPGHPSNGTSLVHFPGCGTRYVSPRFDLRAINLGARPQMSVAEGRGYLPRLAADGSWHLVTRGDSNLLARQCAASEESEAAALSTESEDCLLTSTFSSSIAADEVFAELAKRRLVAHVPLEEEQFADIAVEPSLKIVGSSDLPGVELRADPGLDDVVPPLPAPASVKRPPSSRSTAGKTSWFQPYATNAYYTMVTAMLIAGAIFSGQTAMPDVIPLMTNVAVSSDEFMRQNPKWSKAKVGPDKDSWLAADSKEWEQMFDPEHTTLEAVPGGLAGVPRGTPVYPIKRVCKLKSDGSFKIRYCVLGNLDRFDGAVFAPTICKKIVWLVFAVGVLLRLKNQFFDITGAFMAERPTRDIYVTLDDKVCKLFYS